MSGISRIDKFIIETSGLGSFVEAQRRRAVPINILLGSDKTGKVALMAITALNLALRCFTGSIRICGNNNDIAYFTENNKTIRDKLHEEAERFGKAHRITFVDDKPADGISLSLGCHDDGDYIVDCSGWVAYINKIAPTDMKDIPAAVPATVFSVACIFAKMFKETVMADSTHTKEQWQFSLLSFTSRVVEDDFTNINGLEIGSILLLGVGAIGSAVAFTLALSDYSAEVLVVDKDRYEEPNLETTMLIAKEDAIRLKYKAICIAESLNKGDIRASSHIEEINETSKVLTPERNILICGVDNAETRRKLDGASVDVILNGGIGSQKDDAGHILTSRHRRGEGSPLSVLYANEWNAETEAKKFPEGIGSDECSRIDYLGVAMAVPFLGVATGALLVARCVQESLKTDRTGHYLKLDMLGLQSRPEHR